MVSVKLGPDQSSKDRERPAHPTALSRYSARWQKGVTALATVLQFLVVVLILVTGLLWTGWPWLLALALAVLGLPVVLGVARRTGRDAFVLMLLAVPLASAGAAIALASFNAQHVADTACNDREMAAVAGLRSPSGEPLKFVGTYDGCSASLPTEQVTELATKDFAATLRAHGWTVDNPDGGRMAHKGRVVIFVEPLTESGTGMRISLADDTGPAPL
jgi:hypothetical protein